MKWLQQFKEKKGPFYKFYKEADNLLSRIERHHLFMIAAGIAFNIIVYLIPLILIAIYVVRLIFNEQDISNTLETLMLELLPPTESANKIIHKVVEEVEKILGHSTFFGWIGIGALLWLSSLLISSIRYGLNTIFELKSPRMFVFYKIKDILLTLIISILIFIYSYAVPLFTIVIEYIGIYFPTQLKEIFSGALIRIASIVTSFLMFYFIYRIVPNYKLNRTVIFSSTILCVFAIELARYVFAWYLTELSNYGKFYGTYAVIMSMAIWIYYSALIILLSAEISKYFYDRSRKKRSELTREEAVKNHEKELEEEE